MNSVDKEYDGTPDMTITGIGLDMDSLASVDSAYKDTIMADDVTGVVESSNVGTYTRMNIRQITLIGDGSQNYTAEPTDNVPVADADGSNSEVNITKVTPSAPRLSYSFEQNGDSFTCQISVNITEEYLDYQYNIDGGSWRDNNLFSVEPGSIHTYQARAKASGNVNAGDISTLNNIVTPKLTQDAPDAFLLEFELNEDDPNTFTATIPRVDGAVYSFDGESFSDENTKTDCAPNTSYTGYIKFPETDTYYESSVMTDTQTTPKLQAPAPVIEPAGGEFFGSQLITITCDELEGAEIYYTLDGSEPTTESTCYTEPFEITDACTVSAIATRSDMNHSEVVTAEFSLVSAEDILSRLTVSELTEVPESLTDNEDLNAVDKITAVMTRRLTVQPGYTYQNMAFYDISIEISIDGEEWVPATAENFPTQGITITIGYPEGTGRDTHNFIAAHMFTETSERLDITAGDIEEPPVTKTADGLQLTVKGTSPLAIAWTSVTGDNSGNVNTNTDNQNGTTANTGTDTNASGTGTATGTGTGTGTNAAGTGTTGSVTGTSTTGTNATGNNSANGTTTGNGVTSGLLSAIQTGDVSTLLPWIIGIGASALILIILLIRRFRRR